MHPLWGRISWQEVYRLELAVSNVRDARGDNVSRVSRESRVVRARDLELELHREPQHPWIQNRGGNSADAAFHERRY